MTVTLYQTHVGKRYYVEASVTQSYGMPSYSVTACELRGGLAYSLQSTRCTSDNVRRTYTRYVRKYKKLASEGDA